MNRIPTLDGWRGVAILLVIVSHLQTSLLGHLYRGYSWMDVGQHGVEIFFILSGYLITTLLLEEEKINLKRFYLRRFFRLMPCAWVYLLTLAVIALVTHSHSIGKDVWPCLFFYRNYYPPESAANVLTGHFWSLSLEEQFYLFWPPLLFVIGRRWAWKLAAFGAIACAVYRFYHWNNYDCNDPLLLSHRSEVRVDALFVGCTLAFLLKDLRVRAWILRFGSALFWLCIPVLAWHFYRFQRLLPLSEALVVATMIACTSVNFRSLAAKALEWKHLKFIGLISYSLYVWQQRMLFISQWQRQGAVFLPLVAIGSYGLIERPCIRLGRRLEQALQSRNTRLGEEAETAEPATP